MKKVVALFIIVAGLFGLASANDNRTEYIPDVSGTLFFAQKQPSIGTIDVRTQDQLITSGCMQPTAFGELVACVETKRDVIQIQNRLDNTIFEIAKSHDDVSYPVVDQLRVIYWSKNVINLANLRVGGRPMIPIQVAQNAAFVGDGKFSEPGLTFAYTCADQFFTKIDGQLNPDLDICLVDLSNQEGTYFKIGTAGADIHPFWMNGFLYWMVFRETGMDIVRYNSGIETVLSNLQIDWEHGYDTSGTNLVFVTKEPNQKVQVMNIDTGETLYESREGIFSHPAISGDSLAYVSMTNYANGLTPEVWLASLQSNEIKRLSRNSDWPVFNSQ